VFIVRRTKPKQTALIRATTALELANYEKRNEKGSSCKGRIFICDTGYQRVPIHSNDLTSQINLSELVFNATSTGELLQNRQ
jgi:hypothetical protein